MGGRVSVHRDEDQMREWEREKKTYLLAAVGMIRKSRARLDGEVIQHKERREVLELRRADGPPDARAGALRLLDGQKGLADRARDARLGRHVIAAADAVVVVEKNSEVVDIQSRGRLENVILEIYYRQYPNGDGE